MDETSSRKKFFRPFPVSERDANFAMQSINLLILTTFHQAAIARKPLAVHISCAIYYTNHRSPVRRLAVHQPVRLWPAPVRPNYGDSHCSRLTLASEFCRRIGTGTDQFIKCNQQSAREIKLNKKLHQLLIKNSFSLPLCLRNAASPVQLATSSLLLWAIAVFYSIS